MPVLKKSVELARLSGDGFVDLCCNARETTELAVAAVRRGLVTVDLKELSKSGDSKRAPGVLSAAEAMRRATAESKAREPTRSLMELFGFSKKQNLWAEASVSLEDWNVSFAPKYSKRKNRMTSSSNAANVADREPSSPDAHRRPETPSSAPKTPHLHDWGHELGVVIPAAAALSRQDSQSSPGSSPRFSLAGGKESESPADVSARVVVSHPSFPIFACGSANRGLQIWRFGFEETKKRFQLESSKDSTSNGSNSHSTSSSSPVALSFNAYGERLACATTDGRVALYDSSSSLRTMASRLCVFDSNSNSSAFVAAKPKEVAFVSTLVCAIACESKGYSNGVTGGMMRSEKSAGGWKRHFTLGCRTTKLVEMWCVIRHMRRYERVGLRGQRTIAPRFRQQKWRSCCARSSEALFVDVCDVHVNHGALALRRQLHQNHLFTPPQHLLLLFSNLGTPNPPLRRRQRRLARLLFLRRTPLTIRGESARQARVHGAEDRRRLRRRRLELDVQIR